MWQKQVGLHCDVNDAHRAGANRLQNKTNMHDAVRKHVSGLAPLCASQFVKDGTVAVMQEQRRARCANSITVFLWVCGKRARLSRATFCLIFWSKMRELLGRTNAERSVVGFVSYADDFLISTDEEEADSLWGQTSRVLEEVGLLMTRPSRVTLDRIRLNGITARSRTRRCPAGH